jgi:hypothetical protein
MQGPQHQENQQIFETAMRLKVERDRAVEAAEVLRVRPPPSLPPSISPSPPLFLARSLAPSPSLPLSPSPYLRVWLPPFRGRAEFESTEQEYCKRLEEGRELEQVEGESVLPLFRQGGPSSVHSSLRQGASDFVV